MTPLRGFGRQGRRPGARQSGMSLIITMLMLVAVMLLGLSAAQIALSSEKASRNERDRQVAFQAAEAALLDAELDIQNSTSSTTRSADFSKNSMLGFPSETDAACGAGLNSRGLGLCSRRPEGSPPAWLKVDFSDVGLTTSQSVPYGTFTGQTFAYGSGTSSWRLPRYIIEIMTYNAPGASADQVSYFYRLTAIGYGMRDTTQVVLQTFYRKET